MNDARPANWLVPARQADGGLGLVRFPYQDVVRGWSLRPRLWQRWGAAFSHHHGAGRFDPWQPGEPHGLGPKDKRIERSHGVGKGLQRGRSREVDRNLLRATVGRLTVNDLDVETGQMRG